MTDFLWFLALVIVILLIPPNWDPAISLKEWNIEWAKRIKKKKRGR